MESPKSSLPFLKEAARLLVGVLTGVSGPGMISRWWLELLARRCAAVVVCGPLLRGLKVRSATVAVSH